MDIDEDDDEHHCMGDEDVHSRPFLRERGHIDRSRHGLSSAPQCVACIIWTARDHNEYIPEGVATTDCLAVRGQRGDSARKEGRTARIKRARGHSMETEAASAGKRLSEISIFWWPHRDSNSGFCRERAASLASRRWGRSRLHDGCNRYNGSWAARSRSKPVSMPTVRGSGAGIRTPILRSRAACPACWTTPESCDIADCWFAATKNLS